MTDRPTGIIRTLPSIYADNAEVGREKYLKSLEALEAEKIPAIYIALQAMPKVEVLYLYLVVDGKIDVRLNLAGFEPGDSRKCWDGTYRAPKHWAVCTGPVSRPPEPIQRRGFQGFRYTGDLW